MPPDHAPMIAGLILAGGKGTRMGGVDKALLPLNGKPLIAHVQERLTGQTNGLAISANGDPARFKGFALPVLPDALADFPGPLAGVLAGLKWAQERTRAKWLLSVPCDAPFLPLNLVSRLQAALKDGRAEIAVAASQGQRHPVVALWPLSVAAALKHALIHENLRKVGAFAARYEIIDVDFPLENGRDPFANLNTPEDVRLATKP